MPTTKETLTMCKTVIDALALGKGISYDPSGMIELSGYIAVAIERESSSPPPPPPPPKQAKRLGKKHVKR